MREIILDTETTGLDPATGDRLVEIACVEVLNYIPTGEFYHTYIDPERDVPEGAFKVHGLSTEFLKGKPLFRDVAADFLAFIGESRLVIHNAEFDMKFLNAELKRANLPLLPADRAFDTLTYARRKHPGAANSLDALCARYKIDNSRRTKHGALMDSEILAEVYAELMGGRQATLILASEASIRQQTEIAVRRERAAPLPPLLSQDEAEAHERFLGALGDKAVWRDYVKQAAPAPQE
jgi:DNA polymerase-3 subunit epsilon